MTDSKKTVKDKNTQKSKKLRLNKETLKDLGTSKIEQVKGGAGGGRRCTQDDTGYSTCTD